jgi:hypothetical protein
MHQRLLLGLAIPGALLFPGCRETTYQKVVRAQQDQPTAPMQTWTTDLGVRCPTPAAPGTPTYDACQRALEQEQGVGGSGPASEGTACTEPIRANDAHGLAQCGVPGPIR